MIFYEIVGALVVLGLLALGIMKARDFVKRPPTRRR